MLVIRKKIKFSLDLRMSDLPKAAEYPVSVALAVICVEKSPGFLAYFNHDLCLAMVLAMARFTLSGPQNDLTVRNDKTRNHILT